VGEPPQLSVAVTVKAAVAHFAGAHVFTVMGALGPVIEGPLLSAKVIF